MEILLFTLLGFVGGFVLTQVLIRAIQHFFGVDAALWACGGLLVVIILLAPKVFAETYYTFNYKTKDELRVSVPASDYFEARTKASKICFQALTGGKYQGEEAGLDIIDICSNPVEKK